MVRISRGIIVLLVSLFLLSPASFAVTKQEPAKPAKATYRQITGDVVSVKPSSLVIRSKTKGNITLATTKRTTTVGAKAVKQGDRARVRYRDDKKGKTATRIYVLSAAGKAKK